MDWNELMELTYEAADEFKTSSLYQTYIETKQALNASHLMPLIAEFEHAKSRYEEVSKYGLHHPDYERVSTLFIAAKTALFQTQAYQDYIKALASVNDHLRTFSTELNQLLSTCKISSNNQKSCHTKGR